VFLVNSRLGLFSATQKGSHRVGVHLLGHPFSRSYGVNLPSSLTRVLSLALGFSPRLPVSVCGTGVLESRLEAFLGSVGSASSLLSFAPHHGSGIDTGDLPPVSPYPLGRASPSARCAYPTASPHHSNDSKTVQESQPVVHRLRLSASA